MRTQPQDYIDRMLSTILTLCHVYRVEEAALRAVLAVESRGYGLEADPHGAMRPIIRLEINKVWVQSDAGRRQLLDRVFHVNGPHPWEGHMWRPDPHETTPWRPLHTDQASEWEAFQLAKSISPIAAVMCTSWGAPQIMGWYYTDLGYHDIGEFYTAMHDESKQLYDMMKVIDLVMHATEHMRNLDWYNFALEYNGPGQPEWYAGRLRSAYERISNEVRTRDANDDNVQEQVKK